MNDRSHARPNARAKLLYWARLAALTAAMAAVVAVSTGVTLWHQDTPGTICSICYAAHLPILRSLPVHTPVTTDAVVWIVPAELLLNHAAPERLNSSPRAPPA